MTNRKQRANRNKNNNSRSQSCTPNITNPSTPSRQKTPSPRKQQPSCFPLFSVKRNESPVSPRQKSCPSSPKQRALVPQETSNVKSLEASQFKNISKNKEYVPIYPSGLEPNTSSSINSGPQVCGKEIEYGGSKFEIETYQKPLRQPNKYLQNQIFLSRIPPPPNEKRQEIQRMTPNIGVFDKLKALLPNMVDLREEKLKSIPILPLNRPKKQGTCGKVELLRQI